MSALGRVGRGVLVGHHVHVLHAQRAPAAAVSERRVQPRWAAAAVHGRVGLHQGRGARRDDEVPQAREGPPRLCCEGACTARRHFKAASGGEGVRAGVTALERVRG